MTCRAGRPHRAVTGYAVPDQAGRSRTPGWADAGMPR